jgi:hypothetical protein
VRRLPDGLEVTQTGGLFIRNIAMRFDNTLAPLGRRRFARPDFNTSSLGRCSRSPSLARSSLRDLIALDGTVTLVHLLAAFSWHEQ